MAADSKTV